MIETTQKIKGRPIYDHDQNLIGRVSKPIIDVQNGQVLGFKIAARGVHILVPTDIQEWNSDFILTTSNFEIYSPQDIVRLERSISAKISIKNKKVYTKSNNFLGKVKDYSIDTNAMVMDSLYVNQKLFKILTIRRRIIKQKDIVEIKHNKIIVKDSGIKVPVVDRAKFNAPSSQPTS
ncbi:hypothetical protein GF376_02795 [Candidatus Peregrinibacteria bacterium]|nr:hypothetical protein [Candidatus Peregrinibacteria bacterium]